MKGLYQFSWDCGRMGTLEGLFIADASAVKKLYDKNVYFGEVLGKHSEIEGTIEVGDIVLKSDDAALIEQLEEMFPRPTLCGHNPLDYVDG
jgi:hypothetical protein